MAEPRCCLSLQAERQVKEAGQDFDPNKDPGIEVRSLLDLEYYAVGTCACGACKGFP